jgi:hypothetical protein
MAKPELRDHRKFLKLKRLLGEPTPHVLGYLDCLWHRGYQTGAAFIGDEMDVEAAAEYPGEPGKFARAARESGFIDEDREGLFSIHDLYDHAPKYARLRMKRKGNAPERTCPEVAERGTNVPCDGTDETRNGQNCDSAPPKPRSENPEPKPKTSGEGAPAPKRFVPPTLEELAAYCHSEGLVMNPSEFLDYYRANGWKVGGRTLMKDWQAAVRNWARKDFRSRDRPRGRADPAATLANQAHEAMSRGEPP